MGNFMSNYNNKRKKSKLEYNKSIIMISNLNMVIMTIKIIIKIV